MTWLLVRLLLVGLAGSLAWGLLVGYRATHPPRFRLPLTPADLHLPFDSLTLRAADGVRLAGWRLLPPSPRGVVIVQHGYGTCRADPLAITAMLYRLGYAVVSVDFRGHGESGGICTFGRRERLDVQAMLEAIARDASLRALPIGYLGISMGAAVGLLTAADDPRIRVVVSDSSYAWLGPMVARYQQMMYHLPEIPFGWVTARCLAVTLRTPLARLDPVRAIRRIAPRPVLIIHGEADTSIPVAHARALCAAAGEPKTCWVVPEAGHVTSVSYRESEYAQRIAAIFERGFGRP
ncbi:MAG: alpha/beta hydrolase [Candidatus Omnitrophica bacterium]|nr:alpha/beta hydrolase [Candidatus Omnitrophota bacterium]